MSNVITKTPSPPQFDERATCCTTGAEEIRFTKGEYGEPPAWRIGMYSGGDVSQVTIRYCPWCGHDFDTSAKIHLLPQPADVPDTWIDRSAKHHFIACFEDNGTWILSRWWSRVSGWHHTVTHLDTLRFQFSLGKPKA